MNKSNDVLISKKKPSFKVSIDFKKYFDKYNRIQQIPIEYSDLLRYVGSTQVTDNNDLDTLWQRVYFNESERNEIEDNLNKIIDLSVNAKKEGSELIVFPELALTGHLNGSKNAQKIDSSAIKKLIDFSNMNNLYICFGFAENKGKEFFNSSILIGPEGILGVYRKIHLNDNDRKWASEGNDWKYFDTKIGRVGLLIGYDAIFPESARCLGLYGCDLVLCSSAQEGVFTHGHSGTKVRQNYPIPTGPDPNHWNHFRIRGGENNIFFVCDALVFWLVTCCVYVHEIGERCR